MTRKDYREKIPFSRKRLISYILHPMHKTILLDVQSIHKRYGNLQVVKGISLKIPSGICYGLLGPNGAGKTTTIEMLEDILDLDAGQILYKGAPRDQRFREEIGIQFQNTELPQYLTIGETLKLFHGLYTQAAPLPDIITLCQLEPLLDRDNRKISGGQKQRLLLALALLNGPELIFLDEPTTGMDPQARRHLWDIVKTLKQQGKTLILTTHYMDEAQELCDIIGVMDQGKLLTEGSAEDLIQKYCPYLTLQLPLTHAHHLLQRATRHLTSADKTLHQWQRTAHGFSFKTHSLEQSLKALLNSNIELSQLQVHTPTLEDVFLELTGKRLRE